MSAEKSVDKSAEPAIPLSVVDALIAKIGAISAGGQGISAAQLQDILKGQAADNADALGRLLIPENKVHPHISAFSYPEGDVKRPKPKLADRLGEPRETIFCSARQKEDLLTPAEIQAFNAITEDCEARGGTWWAKVRKEGKREMLWVHVPCAEVDQRMELPSLIAVLKELAEGPKAVDLEALSAQLETLKAQLVRAQSHSASA